jgi:hypothetical protein
MLRIKVGTTKERPFKSHDLERFINRHTINNFNGITMKELYEQYLGSKQSESLEDKINVMNEIVRQNPKMMDYIQNKIDSCFGTHIVYLVHAKVEGVDMLKIGYTKNTVKSRFGEKRYDGSNKLVIVEVLRQLEFQAKGAKDFEKRMKRDFVDYKTTTNLTLPGKNEFYDIEHQEVMLGLYDTLSTEYTEVFGLKSPN